MTDFMNRWITPENVLWISALVSLILLFLVGPVSEIFISERRDSGMRYMKIGLFFLLPLLLFFPAVVLLAGETVRGTPCGLYLLLFSLFCYYLGKRIGRHAGHKGLSELIGLEMFDSIEDAQDRLYESRQRLPAREDVTRAIGAMVKKKPVPGFRPEEQEEGGGYRPRRRRPPPSDVLDVMVEVEEVDEE